MEKVEKIALVESVIKVGEPMHPDFVKIYKQFLKRYCGSPDKACKLGTGYYYGWLNKMGLDDSKPYGEQMEKLSKMLESFKWAAPQIKYWKSDTAAKYYKVEACFSLSSMNNNIYTEDELRAATRTLIGKPVNLNHELPELKGVTIDDAEFEDGAAECVLRVTHQAGRLRNINIQTMIEEEEIVNVSIEANCRRGWKPVKTGWICQGLVFSGLALLTKDVLPGIPLTRIIPVEQLVERIVKVTEGISMKEKEEKVQEKKTSDETDESCDHEATIKTLETKVSTLKQKLQSEGKVVADQKLKLSELKTTKRELEEQLRFSENKTIADLNLQVSTLKREARDLKAQIKSGETKLSATKDEISNKEDRIAELENEIGKADDKFNDVNSRLSELRGLHEKLSDDHTDLVAVNTKLNRKIEIQKDQVDSLTGQMDEMSKKLDDCSDKRFNVSQENIRLTNKLASLNDKLLKGQEREDELVQKVQKTKRVGRILVKL